MSSAEEVLALIREAASLESFHLLVNALYKAYFSRKSRDAPILREEYEISSGTIRPKTNSRAVNELLQKSEELTSQTYNILRKLSSKQLLMRKNAMTIYKCPVCDSPMLMLATFCPFCGSRNVLPTTIAQHIKCGYSAPMREFESNEFKCPYCYMEVYRGDLLLIGKTFLCDDCRRTFRSPTVKIECLNKTSLSHRGDFIFDLIDLHYRTIIHYYPTEELEKIIESGLLYIAALSHYITENKYGEVIRAEELFKGGRYSADLVASKFDLGVRLREGKVVLFDYGSKDILPYTLKKSLLDRTDLYYYVISHDEAFIEELDLPPVDLKSGPPPRMGKVNGNEIEIDQLVKVVSGA